MLYRQVMHILLPRTDISLMQIVCGHCCHIDTFDVLSQFVAKPKPICPNITKEEKKTLQDLRKGDSGVALIADKVS